VTPSGAIACSGQGLRPVQSEEKSNFSGTFQQFNPLKGPFRRNLLIGQCFFFPFKKKFLRSAGKMNVAAGGLMAWKAAICRGRKRLFFSFHLLPLSRPEEARGPLA
jgi:hypothetical protein